MSEDQKPCGLPCPKCGSADIYRCFYARDARIESKKYGVPPSKYVTGYGTYQWTATADHIIHHCRCCQYDWATKPLPKSKKGAA